MSSSGAAEQGSDWARPVVHWAIEAIDPARQRAFYGSLFNWDIADGVIMSFPSGLGGPEPGPAGHIQPGDRSGVTMYIQVRDLSARAEITHLDIHRDA
ncbi:MAG: hypothetical protein AAFX58_12130, partial [Pseudomonadota bacterium]